MFTCEHGLIGVVRDGEDVGWSLNPLLASVAIHHRSIIHWEHLVGVHHHAEQTRVRLQYTELVSTTNIRP